MVGTLQIGDQLRQTQIRLRNITNFEAYITSIVKGYDAEDATLNGFFYKLDTPQFNIVRRSQCGNGCNFKHEIIEYQGNICFIPKKVIVLLNV